jgi:uncharacterized protein
MLAVPATSSRATALPREHGLFSMELPFFGAPAARRRLGWLRIGPIIDGMNIRSDHPDHGFQFPGVFEITAMGPAGAGLEERIPEVLEAIGIVVLRETVAARNSTGGRFVSIRLSFHAEDRGKYEAAHAALRADPDIKWTL